MRRTSPALELETQTEPAPIATPETPRPSRIRERTRPLSGSTADRVPSEALVTQTVSGPTARRSGGLPTAIGSETEGPPPKSFWDTKPARSTARITPTERDRRFAFLTSQAPKP